MWHDLPDAVISEIFERLPVESLIQCTCVCKSWLSFIKCSEFVHSHLHRTLGSDQNHFIVRQFHHNQYAFCYGEDLDQFMSFKPPLTSRNFLPVVASCNGLLCLFKDDFPNGRYGNALVLWNPSIKKSLLVPFPDIILKKEKRSRRSVGDFVGLGYDSKHRDFKVLMIMKPPIHNVTTCRTELYSLNSNTWKDISHIVPDYIRSSEHSVYLNDSLYWLAYVDYNSPCPIKGYRGNFLAVFDLREEVFRHITLPNDLQRASILVVKLFEESSIAVIDEDSQNRDKVSHIYVMKKSGAVPEWVKVATVGNQTKGMSTVLGFRKSGDVLIKFDRGGLALLNFQNQYFKTLVNFYHSDSYVCSYTESLALLDKGDNAAKSRYPKGASFKFFEKKLEKKRKHGEVEVVGEQVKFYEFL